MKKAEYYIGVMHTCIELIEKIDNEDVKTLKEMRDVLLDTGHQANNDCNKVMNKED